MADLKYFTKDEFKCDGVNCFNKMNPELLTMIDDAREIADVPFTITSSWRSKAFNQEVINGLISAGFTRIGIAKTFIHADCDMTLPQEVMFLY